MGLFDSFKNTVKSVTRTVANTASSAAHTVKDIASDAIDEIEEHGSNMIDTVKETAVELSSDAEDLLEDIKDKAGELGGDLKDAAAQNIMKPLVKKFAEQFLKDNADMIEEIRVQAMQIKNNTNALNGFKDFLEDAKSNHIDLERERRKAASIIRQTNLNSIVKKINA